MDNVLFRLLLLRQCPNRYHQQAGVAQLAAFFKLNGEVLFGTDVGYMSDYNTREEFTMMQRAGMQFDDILASLTVNPSRRFSESSGQLAVGQAADLVIYAADPRDDVGNFSKLAMTIKSGHVVFSDQSLIVGATRH